jgi:nitroimidazol reductase NimA-like FMN-containing flavoprotein (pyridoxamine 5'-phosphate oxidase superfamily)
MIGTLTNEQIEHILRGGLIGRIGCCDGNSVYVVPVTYVFDGEHIYAHSREGLKIQIMRANPVVCFEVDSIETMTNWRCVIVHGEFQELKTAEEQERGLKILKDRLAPYLLSETLRPRGFDYAPAKVEKDRKPVIYRIQISRMSGRYEKNTNFGNLIE